MKKILLIRCSVNNNSPRGSISGHALDIFKKEYQSKYPNDEIIEKDLNKIESLFTVMNDKNISNWFDDESRKLIAELKSVDKLIIATSMMNYNYPALLKNYIDKICLANETFKFKYNNGKGGSEGLLTNLKTSFIIAQGSPIDWYPFSAIPSNLEGLFNFLGSELVKPLIIDGTQITENISKTKEEIVNNYLNEITELVNRMN